MSSSRDTGSKIVYWHEELPPLDGEVIQENAIEAISDLRWRGGRLMINRRIRPWRTAVNLAAMTSRCQFIARLACGLSSWKQRPAKLAKSRRSTIRIRCV